MRRMGVVVGSRRAGNTRPGLLRLVDAANVLMSMAVLWPLAVVCAIAIRLESGGPVLINENGLRFRTVGCDGKLTRLGRFLRKSELDALPQLFVVAQ